MDVFSGHFTFVRTVNPFLEPDGKASSVYIPLEHATLETIMEMLYEYIQLGYVFVGFGGQIEQQISVN